MKTQYLCFPLNTKPTTITTTSSSSPTSSTTTNGRVSPPGSSSLLDRFREAVFRLIMATALSKANNNNSSSSTTLSSSSRLSTNNHDYRRNNSSSSNNNNHGHESVRRSCYLYDPYHIEALADCIEFIKKKSASSSPSDRKRLHDEIDGGDDDHVNTRGSTVSDVDVVIPLPVM